MNVSGTDAGTECRVDDQRFPKVDPSNVVKMTFEEGGERWDARVVKRESGDWYEVKEDGVDRIWYRLIVMSYKGLISLMGDAVELEYVVADKHYRVRRVAGEADRVEIT